MGPFLKGISSWYGDKANLISLELPWLRRGGHNGFGTDAGMFSYNCVTGKANTLVNFRVVVS